MNRTYKDREALRPEYEQFIQTERVKSGNIFGRVKQVQKEAGILLIIFMTFIQKCCSNLRR